MKLRTMNQNRVLDPFKILGVSPTAPMAQIKVAYKKAILKLHPDKVAHLPAEKRQKIAQYYNLVETAYKQILHDYGYNQNASENRLKDRETPQVPDIIGKDNFEINNFNQTFNQLRTNNDHIYQIDPNQNVTRDKISYHQERSEVDRFLGHQKPLFNGNFNQNAFNQVFVQSGATTSPSSNELINYQAPNGYANSMVDYTELNSQEGLGQSQGLTSLNYGNIQQSYNGVENPNQIDWSKINPSNNSMKDSALDKETIRARMNAYRQVDLNSQAPVNPEPSSMAVINHNRQLEYCMEMQMKLLTKLDRLFEARSPQTVNVIDDSVQRAQIKKLETEIAQLRKKLAVQDKLLNNKFN